MSRKAIKPKYQGGTENPVNRTGKAGRRVEKPIKFMRKAKGSDYSGPHSNVSYASDNPLRSASVRDKKAISDG